MRQTPVLVGYLNGFFAPEVWRPAGNLLGNITASEISNKLDDIPLVSGFDNVRLDFDRPPSINGAPNDRVQIRVPGTGTLRLDGDVVITDPLPDSGLGAAVTFDFEVGSVQPNPSASLDIDFEIISGVARGLLAVFDLPLFIQMLEIEEAVEFVAELALRQKVDEKLGGLRSYRFDRSIDLTGPFGLPPEIRFVPSASFFGSEDPHAAGYIDLLLVPDGCTAADLVPFDELSVALAERLSPTSSTAPAPFLQFRSAIRVWTMPLVVANPADRIERTIFPVQTDRSTLNFSNLARVAEIGQTAMDRFAHHPIIVFLSRVTNHDRVDAGMSSSATIRANTQGPYLLLQLPSWGPGDVDTVIHELGHSPLGNYLADEYPAGTGLGGCTFEAGTKLYKGPEPRPRNVAMNPLTGWAKWQPWSGSLINIISNLHAGGYEHDQGVFRFSDTCRMRCVDASAFCPICREELSVGFVEQGHLRSGSEAQPGAVDLLVEYLEPWREAQPRRLRLQGGATEHLEALVAGDTGPATRLRLQVIGSTVPEDWEVLWDVSRNAGNTFGPLSGRAVEIEVKPQALVELTVRHLASGVPLFGPNRPAPMTSASIVFDIDRHVTENDLLLPDQLVQSVGVGAVLVPVVDQVTGNLSLPEALWIEARNTGARGLRLATAVSFRWEGPGASQETRDAPIAMAGVTQRWNITRVLPRGQYTWSASTLWRGIRSQWVAAPRSDSAICWEIAPVPFASGRRPPADPFDLQLMETLTYPARPSGLQASSWHPNDRPIKFNFELKLDPQPFDGQGLLQTGLQSRDPANAETLAVVGNVPFSLFPRPGSSGDLYRWRVRAVDDRGDASSWVEGRSFLIYLAAGRPRDLEEFMRLLNDVRILDLAAGGPLGIPRLFMASERDWSFESETGSDFSRLKEIISRLPPNTMPKQPQS